MTSLKTSIKTITYLSDIGCLEIQGASLTPVIKHCTGDLEEFLRQLIEQDPLVTIDIITHRYYGVGGQWVQDAGEYLHMMSDAGIRIKGE